MVSNVLGDSMAKDVLALVKESLPIIRPCGSPEKNVSGSSRTDTAGQAGHLQPGDPRCAAQFV